MKKLKFNLSFLSIVLILFSCSENSSESTLSSEKIIDYSILNEEIHDVPLKTQISLEVLIDRKDLTKDKIENLLNSIYKQTKDRVGFKHHVHPSAIYIYAYTSKEKAESGMGQWVGMISKNHSDSDYTIDINQTQLKETSSVAIDKFGLTEEQRMNIYKEIAIIELKAQADADKKYPIDNPSTTEKQMNNNSNFFEKQQSKYLAKLASKYKTSSSIIDSIGLEGFKRKWALPNKETVLSL